MQQNLSRLTSSSATAFLCAVLCVYPLYIDRFSNLGVTKFTGCFTLFLLFSLWLGACTAIGAHAPAGRYRAARRDLTLWGVAAFVVTTLVSTVFSLSSLSSVWGLGGYYGGLMMVLFTAAGYWCIRSYADAGDFGFLTLGVGVTSSLVAVFYLLNIFNIDLIGTYANTAVVERAQFFSTLGQKDFNASSFAVTLPLVFYAFLFAPTRRRAAAAGVPAFFGALALAIVDSEALTLGIAAAAMVMVCHRDFTTRQLRRTALVAAAFFGWAWTMHLLRASVYTQGGTALLAKLGDPRVALPGAAVCLVLWALLALRSRSGRAEVSLCLPGRVLTGAVLVLAVAAVAVANCLPTLPLPGRLHNLLVFSDDWGTYRGTAWRIAFSTWADGSWWRKLIGVGPGMMHEAVAAWAGDAVTPRMNTFYAAHNEYLEQLLTTGLLGLAAWVLLIAAHLRRGFANWQRPGVAPVLLALCSYLAQSVVSIRVSMVFPLVMLLFGLLTAFTSPSSPAPPERRPAGRKQHPPKPLTRRQRAVRYAKITAAAIAGMAVSGALSGLLFWFLL